MREGSGGCEGSGARHSGWGGAKGARIVWSVPTSGRGGVMRTKMVCGEGSDLTSERRYSGKDSHFAKRRRWLTVMEGSRGRAESRALLIAC